MAMNGLKGNRASHSLQLHVVVKPKEAPLPLITDWISSHQYSTGTCKPSRWTGTDARHAKRRGTTVGRVCLSNPRTGFLFCLVAVRPKNARI